MIRRHSSATGLRVVHCATLLAARSAALLAAHRAVLLATHRVMLLVALGAGVLAATTGCGTHAQPAAEVASDKTADRVTYGQLTFVVGFEQGLEEARRVGKPMLTFFVLDDCPYCEAMIQEAFNDSRLARAGDRFVCVLVNADRDEAACQRCEVRAYPTVQFLSPQGAPISQLTGKQPAQRLVSEMQTALQWFARRDRESSLR